MKKTRSRKNFTIKASVLSEMEKLIPKGEWSQFVNDALENAMVQLSRQKSAEAMRTFKEKSTLPPLSDEEIKTKLRYGLK